MTGAERAWAGHYQIGDVVRFSRGSKVLGIEAGGYASVAAVDATTNQLTVEKANAEHTTYDPRRLTGVSVYREIDREFSVGDRIQFTAPDKLLEVANRDLPLLNPLRTMTASPPFLISTRRLSSPRSTTAISIMATPSQATTRRA
jgi:hypothetical protein